MIDTKFNLALAQEAVSAAVPDREYLVWRDRRCTYAQLTERSRRLADYLRRRGLGAHVARSRLAGHESGQDHIALYMRNGNEFIESMLAAFKSRTVPVNVNYRYVADELRYLLDDSRARAVIYHADFAPLLAQVRDALPADTVLIQVADDSDNELLPGAVDFESALANGSPEPPVAVTADDLHIIYTGGTTGMPKAVLWRQHDIFLSAMGGQLPGAWQPVKSYDELVQRAKATPPMRVTLLAPLMHGAAQWAAFTQINLGGTILLPDDTTRMNAADVLHVVEREKANTIMMIGDAMARPLIAELEATTYDLSSLFLIGSGSVALTPPMKQRIHDLLPQVVILDGMGASETGPQGTYVSTKESVTTGVFTAGPAARVINDELNMVLEPGTDALGWLAQTGNIPLGYLGDAEKTARTFPVIDGVRYAVPGDRARLLDDGSVRVLGRDSVTINSGGEKIFAEEVETAVKSHPSIVDVVVTARPSERWGQEVVAVVQLAGGAELDAPALAAHAAQSLARYKLPKAWIRVPEVRRSPAGKADYRWASSIAAQYMTLDITDRNRVRTVALNRPERLNAFNNQMVGDLAAALQQAVADPEVAVILLTGTGRAFSAGADLKEIADHFTGPASTATAGEATSAAFVELVDVLSDLSKPLVVAVNGVGVGFGMTILGFADIAFMSSEARLRCPFTAIGAPPEAASTYLLPMLLGRQNAAWTLLSSEWIAADEAREIGLVWKICAPDELIATAHRHAETLADKPTHILTTVKRLLNAPHREQVLAAAARENQAMAELIGTGSNVDAVSAFVRGD